MAEGAGYAGEVQTGGDFNTQHQQQQQSQQQEDYAGHANGQDGHGGMYGGDNGPRGYGAPAGGGGYPPGMGGSTFVPGKIFIGGLDGSTTKESLTMYCAQWGEMSDIVLMEGRGFGFVTYSDPQCAQAFLETREHTVDNKKVEAKAAVPKNAGGSSGLTRKMFVGGTGDIGQEEFQAHFEKFGDIEDCVILRKPDGTSRGFGFVTYKDESMVEKCLVVQHILSGKQVEVKRAVKKEDMAAGMGYDQSYAARTGKAPDWHCPDCKNKNFGWREVCNRCQAAKPMALNALGMMGMRGGNMMMNGMQMGMQMGMGGMGGYGNEMGMMGNGMGYSSAMGNGIGMGMGHMGGGGFDSSMHMANMGGMGGNMGMGGGGYGGGNMGRGGSGFGMGGGGGFGMGGGGNLGAMHNASQMQNGGIGQGGMSSGFAGGGGNQGGFNQAAAAASGTGYSAAYSNVDAGQSGYGGGAGAAAGAYHAGIQGGQQGGYGGGAGAASSSGSPYGGGAGGHYGGGAGAAASGYGNSAGGGYGSGQQQGSYGPQSSYGRATQGRGMAAQRYRPY